ncbi:hypothetical protein O0L34_g12339 [Tuta absoluta]|nr:hypothetical protein O0L34_g12339 [Tuta absoluta]
MSAKSKKRLCKLENKLLKLEKLELKDVVCSICQSILVEPVALPCFHYFCHGCFNGSIENNALCCPLCRLRIGSWLRTATKQNSLVNVELWNFIRNKFPKEIAAKLKGDDVEVPEDIPAPRLSAPGEIRSEYEAELQRLRTERLKLEQKHIEETQLLIKQIQQEEQEAQKQYLERIKQDELLAKKIQHHEGKSKPTAHRHNFESKQRKSLRDTLVRPKLKATKIDGYLAKIQAPIAVPIESPLLRDDNSTDDSSTSKSVNGTSYHGNASKTVKTGASAKSLNENNDSCNGIVNDECSKLNSVKNGKITSIADSKENNRLSPEMVPRNGKIIRNLDKKYKGSSLWNKENGEKEKDEIESHHPPSPSSDLVSPHEDEKKAVIKSLLVSLPLPNSGVLHHKTNLPVTELKKTTDTETESVDSMRQELCFFKPIEKTLPTSVKARRKLPVRVPSVRPTVFSPIQPPAIQTGGGIPTRAQYLDSLCKLRHLSLAGNMKSAFVIALESLKVLKNARYNMNTRQGTKRLGTDDIPTMPTKKVAPNKKTPRVPNNTKNHSKVSLRRTRSMGSMVKDENETTPKKAKILERRAVSDRKPHLRSDTKKITTTKTDVESPTLISKIVNDKVKLAVKNLSSPLKNCDLEKILEEQIRIEKIIEQEKKDLELAQKMDAELNGGRQLRRAPAKRQVTLNYALRPAKKVKV